MGLLAIFLLLVVAIRFDASADKHGDGSWGEGVVELKVREGFKMIQREDSMFSRLNARRGGRRCFEDVVEIIANENGNSLDLEISPPSLYPIPSFAISPKPQSAVSTLVLDNNIPHLVTAWR